METYFLQDKIRLLHEDLESERELRQRIEREKADLSVQVIQLSERLEEAEGGAESAFEVNKKRDTELLKLRKLLEDVHLESEETAHLLKKKHQEIVVDFQDQIDQLTKARSRYTIFLSYYLIQNITLKTYILQQKQR